MGEKRTHTTGQLKIHAGINGWQDANRQQERGAVREQEKKNR